MKRRNMGPVLEGLDASVHDADLVHPGEGLGRGKVGREQAAAPGFHEYLDGRLAMGTGAGGGNEGGRA